MKAKRNHGGVTALLSRRFLIVDHERRRFRIVFNEYRSNESDFIQMK